MCHAMVNICDSRKSCKKTGGETDVKLVIFVKEKGKEMRL